MHLTLFIPELLWPEPDDKATFDDLRTPALDRLLGRARLQQAPRRDSETALLALFEQTSQPAAPFRLLGESGPISEWARQGHWLCADPVHLRFHHERIVLADAGAFDLDTSEAESLVAALNREFADIGTFCLGSARRWYLRLNVAVDHPAAPLSAVAGRRIDGQLPQSAAPLTRWLNEVQMFLHDHPVNADRAAHGKPAINSLWLWGGGVLPAQSPAPFSSIRTDNPLARGLALASNTPLQPETLTPDALLCQGGDHPCVILDGLQAGVFYENGQGWRDTLAGYEAEWFAPLRAALGRTIERLTLVAPTLYGELHLELSASARWKFWQRPLAPAHLAHQLVDTAEKA